MVKSFRGQVKIADVKEEFDKIVGRINSMVDAYNASLSVQDIDYSIAAGSLSPSGYCLTVGGLKQILNDYEGSVIGCKAYKISDNQIKVTNGLLFHNGKLYKINDRVLAGDNKNTLYYDITYNRLSLGASSDTSTAWTNYTIPNFTSSSTFGNIFSNYNSGTAYKARKNSVGAWNSGWNMGNINTFANAAGIVKGDWSKARTLTWNFPSGVRITADSTITIKLACKRYQQALLTAIAVSVNNGTKSVSFADWATVNENAIGTLRWTFNTRGTIRSLKFYILNAGVTSSGWNMYMDSLTITNVQKSTIVSTGERVGKLVKISDLNMDRSFKYANSIRKTQASGLKKYRYTMSKKAYGKLGKIAVAEAFNNSTQGNFYIADTQWAHYGSYIKLFGTNVEGELHNGHRTYNATRMYSPLYIPKGLPVPYTYTGGKPFPKARTATKKTS